MQFGGQTDRQIKGGWLHTPTATCHGVGVGTGDLKPLNIVRDTAGVYRLIDFDACARIGATIADKYSTAYGLWSLTALQPRRGCGSCAAAAHCAAGMIRMAESQRLAVLALCIVRTRSLPLLPVGPAAIRQSSSSPINNASLTAQDRRNSLATSSLARRDPWRLPRSMCGALELWSSSWWRTACSLRAVHATIT